jgi:MinD superfamily P-loop ATPase
MQSLRRVCPTGAILPFPWRRNNHQIGEVDLLKDKCVVYINHQNCGACVEVAHQDITFVNKNNILYPVVDNRYCVGCGACSQACPTDPKSIIVKPNAVHKKAVKSLTKDSPVQQKDAVPGEFPF